VRLLDNFAIYDWDTLRLVPIVDLLDLGLGSRYGASGLVRPWTDDSDSTDYNSDEDDSLTSQTTKLSPILELNVHHFSSSAGLDE
jgi:DNA (cytosine-5)-methyltransferase 1